MAVRAAERSPRARRSRPLVLRLGSRRTPRRRTRRLDLVAQALAILGPCLAVVVAPGGEPWGTTARVVVVLGGTALAVVGSRRADLRQRAALALVAGAVGVVVGWGIGVTHTVESGITARSAAGLLALVIGVTLLLTGLTTLLSTLRGRQRLLVVACVPFSLAGVLAPLATAVSLANPPPAVLGLVTPGDRGFAYDDVELRTPDGITLRGWYIPSRNRAAVALVHDSRQTRSSMLSRGVALASEGYGVLLFDTRGSGRSDGDAMGLGWFGPRDVAAAVTFLSSRYDVDRHKIGLVGVGRGGEAALSAAASDRRVQAVVAEGVGRRSPLDMPTLPLSPEGWARGLYESLTQVHASLLRNVLPPLSLRRAVTSTAPRWVLLVADDGSLDASRVYRASSPSNVVVWEVPAAEHGEVYRTRAAAWEKHVLDFLRKTLYPRQRAGG